MSNRPSSAGQGNAGDGHRPNSDRRPTTPAGIPIRSAAVSRPQSRAGPHTPQDGATGWTSSPESIRRESPAQQRPSPRRRCQVTTTPEGQRMHPSTAAPGAPNPQRFTTHPNGELITTPEDQRIPQPTTAPRPSHPQRMVVLPDGELNTAPEDQITPRSGTSPEAFRQQRVREQELLQARLNRSSPSQRKQR